MKYARKFSFAIKHTDTGLLKSLDNKAKKLPGFLLFPFQLLHKIFRFLEYLPPIRNIFYKKIIFEGPSNEQLKKIYDQYDADNIKLEKLLKLKLKNYGY